jgi:hypothetical protein
MLVVPEMHVTSEMLDTTGSAGGADSACKTGKTDGAGSAKPLEELTTPKMLGVIYGAEVLLVPEKTCDYGAKTNAHLDVEYRGWCTALFKYAYPKKSLQKL